MSLAWDASGVSAPSGTVTLLFTDVEGSTRLWQTDESAMRVALSRHDELLRRTVTEHDGVVFSTMGDGIAAAFRSASGAVAAAVEAQRLLGAEPWPTATPVRVRMGLHTGEAELRDGDYLGTAVNRAARLMAIGHGGQVLVSSVTAAVLGEGLELVDLGEHRLRDLDRPMHVFQLGVGSFPPLGSLESFLGNLPLQVSSFIGRQREIEAGSEALASSRVVTLTGVGGVGKTRLALQVAAEVLPRFRDGAWLVELAPVREPAEVADAVAAVFGVGARAAQSAPEALVGFLRAKQMVLVLDNCEHVIDAAADLVERIERSCAGVVVLATSRAALGVDGEQILAVPSLGIPAGDADFDGVARADAVVLFVDRARRVKADFVLTAANAPLVSRVCRRLDGMPLGVELAAARVRAMTPAELADGLEERFEILSGVRHRGVERHQTLRAVIDWSYDLLAEPEKRLLVRMSVFAGGCTRQSAEVVCSGDPVERTGMLDLLAGLVDKSLVVADVEDPDTRYGLLETIREYGRDRVAEHGETQPLQDAHAEHYYDLAAGLVEQAGGSEQLLAVRRLVAERENLLAAMAHALRSGHADLALRILSVGLDEVDLGCLPRFSVEALNIAGAAEHRLYPAGLAVAAFYSSLNADLAATEALCEASLSAARRLDSHDPRIEWKVLWARATAAFSLGDLATAADYYARGVGIRRALDPGVMLSTTLSVEAACRGFAGDYGRGLPLATEGLAIARRLGTPLQIAYNLVVLAGALAEQDPSRARALLREAADVGSNLGTIPHNSIVERLLLGAAALGDWDTVLDLAPDTIRGLYWLGDRPQLVAVFNVVARAVAEHDAASAAVLQGAARRLATPTAPHVPAASPPGSSAPNPKTERGSSPGVGLVVNVRRQTTAILTPELGDQRLRNCALKANPWTTTAWLLLPSTLSPEASAPFDRKGQLSTTTPSSPSHSTPSPGPKQQLSPRD
jgi:predicted ATPase/class 3 adenylate cyclase